MQTERSSWIDNIKVIAIFLVVLGHYIDTSIVKAYIYSFHMHLFFFLSGFLFRKKYVFIDYLKKRVSTLLVPYFLFSFLNFAFFLLRRQYGRTPDLSIDPFQKFIDILTWNEFWFLGTLFVVSILFFGIANKIRSKKDLLMFALICTCGHLLISTHFSDIVHENLTKCFTGIVFYSVGYFLRDKLNSNNLYVFMEKRTIFFILLVAINLFTFGFCYKSYGLININFHDNYLFFYLLSFSGIFIVLCLSQYIKANVFFSFVGSNTILIYLLEGYPPGILARLMERFFAIDNFSNIHLTYAFFYSVMTILILVPFILIINRYFPFIIGRPMRQTSSDVRLSNVISRLLISPRRLYVRFSSAF